MHILTVDKAKFGCPFYLLRRHVFFLYFKSLYRHVSIHGNFFFIIANSADPGEMLLVVMEWLKHTGVLIV